MSYIILEFDLCVVIAEGIAALGFACSRTVLLVDEGIASVLRAKRRAPSQTMQRGSIIVGRGLIGKRSGVSGTGPESLVIG